LGYRQPEFDAFGISLGERRRRFNESITLMRPLWTEERLATRAGSTRSTTPELA
jgi:alkanesulfonate monooxygenase SsuD/methylene tetrahydromethanopterin reductase-like flavin-dependent oxidoreductase (luciferase family)